MWTDDQLRKTLQPIVDKCPCRSCKPGDIRDRFLNSTLPIPHCAAKFGLNLKDEKSLALKFKRAFGLKFKRGKRLCTMHVGKHTTTMHAHTHRQAYQACPHGFDHLLQRGEHGGIHG